jgi:3-deoxy-manno-octulosonate cytidylyltransferase (CMP-KDO synthetase)
LFSLAHKNSDLKTAVIIPSRLASVRLPRKPLHLIAGVSLVERVWHQAIQSGYDVFIATDSDEIASHVTSFGGNFIMTPVECESGTERVAVAAKSLPDEYQVIINVQGDEPLIAPDVIKEVASQFELRSSVLIATPITLLLDREDLANSNAVKVALAADGRALYFSRSPIPYVREPKDTNTEGLFWKHIGVYGFRRKTLGQLAELLPSKLEHAERLEQLRWLDAGYPIQTVKVDYDSVAVDTIEDVQRVEAILLKAK